MYVIILAVILLSKKQKPDKKNSLQKSFKFYFERLSTSLLIISAYHFKSGKWVLNLTELDSVYNFILIEKTLKNFQSYYDVRKNSVWNYNE